MSYLSFTSRLAGAKLPLCCLNAWRSRSLFCRGSNWEAALALAVSELAAEGYIFEDVMNGKVTQLKPSMWDGYIAQTWPECPNHFPPQAEMKQFIKAGGVIFGPFLCWESE